jgi:hypothetical protein
MMAWDAQDVRYARALGAEQQRLIPRAFPLRLTMREALEVGLLWRTAQHSDVGGGVSS